MVLPRGITLIPERSDEGPQCTGLMAAPVHLPHITRGREHMPVERQLTGRGAEHGVCAGMEPADGHLRTKASGKQGLWELGLELCKTRRRLGADRNITNAAKGTTTRALKTSEGGGAITRKGPTEGRRSERPRAATFMPDMTETSIESRTVNGKNGPTAAGTTFPPPSRETIAAIEATMPSPHPRPMRP